MSVRVYVHGIVILSNPEAVLDQVHEGIYALFLEPHENLPASTTSSRYCTSSMDKWGQLSRSVPPNSRRWAANRFFLHLT